MSDRELDDWLAVAVGLAQSPGDELLRQQRRGDLDTTSKQRRRELVTNADRAAERLVVGGLQQRFPDHGILAEEGVLTTAGETSRASEWSWVVDPLDGTTNFVHGVPMFAVAIGLCHRGVPVLGVVHAPALGDTYLARRGGGSWRHSRDGSRQRLAVSRTEQVADALLATGFSYHRNEPGRDDNLGRLARALPVCRDLRRLGSAELDLCLCAAGTFDGYWELDLQPYDMAAGAIVVREAGGTVSDLRGRDGWLFGGRILASNGRLHAELLALVGDDAEV